MVTIDEMGPQKGGDAPPPYSKTKAVAKPNWRGRLLALFRSKPKEQLTQSVSRAEKEPSTPQPAPKNAKSSPTKTPAETSEPPIAECNRCKRPFFLKPGGQFSSCGRHHPGKSPFQSGMHTERVYEHFGCSDADYGNRSIAPSSGCLVMRNTLASKRGVGEMRRPVAKDYALWDCCLARERNNGCVTTGEPHVARM